jgi:HEAT repeat protein
VPSFFTAQILLVVIIAGSGLALLLLLATVAGRLSRESVRRRRQAAERDVRPMVLAAVAGDEIPAGLISARGARGRAAERVAYSFLDRVTGEGHGRLTQVLADRGAVTAALRRSARPWWQARARGARQLGLIATAEAGRRLADMVISDHSPEVRVVATRAGTAGAATTLLRSLGRPGAVPEGIVASALLEVGPEAVPALREALDGEHGSGPRQQAMAAEVLGLLDDAPAWKVLAARATSDDPELRVRAVRALGRLGVRQSVPPVLARLTAPEQPAIRAVAATALGRIGDARAAAVLAGCLSDPDYWVAHNCAQALAALGPAGRAELVKAAGGHRLAAGHAREALAAGALARGQPPPLPAGTAGPGQPAAGTPAPQPDGHRRPAREADT